MLPSRLLADRTKAAAFTNISHCTGLQNSEFTEEASVCTGIMIRISECQTSPNALHVVICLCHNALATQPQVQLLAELDRWHRATKMLSYLNPDGL